MSGGVVHGARRFWCQIDFHMGRKQTLLENIAICESAIHAFNRPVPTAQNLLDEMIRRHLASDGLFDDYIFDKHNGSTVLEIAEEWGLVIPERMKRPEGLTTWKRKAEEDALQQGELEVVAPEVVE